MGDTWVNHGFHRVGRRTAGLIGLIAIMVLVALPSSASAAPCPVNPGNSTAWIGGSSGSFNDDLNWSNGGPSGVCDVSITAPGTYTVSMTGGASMKSFTLGGPGSSPTLDISAANPNTDLNATTTGISIADSAAIVLTCPTLPTNCNGGSSGGPKLNAGSSTITNEGAITVAAASGTGNSINGNLINTGTIQLDQNTRFPGGTVTNQGAINIADGVTAISAASHCGDSTGAVVKNDTGGSIAGTGTGTFDIVNYEQGAGSTSGTNPVQMPCGSLKYSGNGASKVQAYGGFTLTGEMQTSQSLTVTAVGSNTNANLGGNFTNKGSITLTCPEGGCNGGSGGGAGFNVNDKDFVNAGTFTVAAASGTGAGVGANFEGTITNTGTMQFDQSAGLGGPVVNQGAINIADTKVVTASGSSCGDAGSTVKNDTGGSINATGAGTFNISTNYEQGNGTTTGDSPVNMPCGNLKYSGNGAGKVQVNGGFGLTGEMQAGQSLIVSAAGSNANANLGGDFTNKGSITLTCPGGGCSGGSGGGAGFNVNNKDFVNAGTFTVAAASGTGAGVGANFEGTITNTGTMQFDQSAGLGGPVVNKGPINIADGKTVTSSGSSCGDTGASVKNDTGGQINATGTGTLSVLNYEQGAGTTSGAIPVQIPCGSLKYSGNGASVVQANGLSMTGNVSSAQTLRIVGGINSPAFTNAGTIVLDQTTSPTLNLGGNTLTNTGTISGGGTINGSVSNSSGVVAPGASPGTLTFNNNYTQGAGGRLDIEVNGTAAGQFDKLAVGGDVTLGGTLALQPSTGYAASAPVGDSVAFLTYGGTRTNPFAQTTVNPSMACPKQLGATYNDGAKNVSAVVSSSGASCGGGGGNGGSGNGGSGGNAGGGGGGVITDPPPPSLADTKLGIHPPAKVKTKKSKAKVSFSFSSDLAGAKFECKLDKGPFKTCKSPKSYKVKPGKHKFSVRAVGSGGAADPTPASFSFKVIREKR